jgi:hypothetical protein
MRVKHPCKAGFCLRNSPALALKEKKYGNPSLKGDDK